MVELESMRPENSRARVRLLMEFAPATGELEVPDPYYRDAGGFQRVLDLTTAASRGLLAALRLAALD